MSRRRSRHARKQRRRQRETPGITLVEVWIIALLSATVAGGAGLAHARWYGGGERPLLPDQPLVLTILGCAVVFLVISGFALALIAALMSHFMEALTSVLRPDTADRLFFCLVPAA